MSSDPSFVKYSSYDLLQKIAERKIPVFRNSSRLPRNDKTRIFAMYMACMFLVLIDLLSVSNYLLAFAARINGNFVETSAQVIDVVKKEVYYNDFRRSAAIRKGNRTPVSVYYVVSAETSDGTIVKLTYNDAPPGKGEIIDVSFNKRHPMSAFTPEPDDVFHDLSKFIGIGVIALLFFLMARFTYKTKKRAIFLRENNQYVLGSCIEGYEKKVDSKDNGGIVTRYAPYYQVHISGRDPVIFAGLWTTVIPDAHSINRSKVVKIYMQDIDDIHNNDYYIEEINRS